MTVVLPAGTMIAGYRVGGVLGKGGMGVVYEARQLSLDRSVALKVLIPELSADPGFRERFRREGLIQARIDHPNIVAVYEAGDHDGALFLVMRLVRGTTLKELITPGGLDAARALRLLRPVADALDAAHDAGLVHRDIKPQNILVGARDHVFLADFGLTRTGDRASGLTRSGQWLGTPDYMAPEQIRGETPAPAVDQYAIAAVLHECLTGEVPFPKQGDAAVLWAHMSDPPPLVSARRPDLPPGLDAVVARGLAKH
ncbi:MAG: serine/threonine kinase PknH, partial [Solirubrobacteraceae bacterium]|nr:serine/threonine kinase PknH [Solirubrobacteraceae bacterium]